MSNVLIAITDKHLNFTNLHFMIDLLEQEIQLEADSKLVEVFAKFLELKEAESKISSEELLKATEALEKLESAVEAAFGGKFDKLKEQVK